MEDELEEMQEEHEEEYNRKMMLYQEEMTKWKNQQEAKVVIKSELVTCIEKVASG